ncbi:MAG: PHP domain-containing protein [Candidatus Sumerlaeota bacterium]
MQEFRYKNSTKWLKGNTHIHSTRSDGGKTVAELARMYADAGYDFLCHTDHWVCSDAANDDADYPLLFLDGVEIHGIDTAGSDFHIVCLGRFDGIDQEMGLERALESIHAQNGFIILAHPYWMGNSEADAIRHPFHAVEKYNHVCQWLNGKAESGAYWEMMLERNPGMLALAVDDAHIRPEHPGWNGGWICVAAEACPREALLDAIWKGRYYSSTGPEIHTLELTGQRLHATCSSVQFARLVGPGTLGRRLGGFDTEPLTEFDFEVPQDWPYVYLEIENADGTRAWTNNLFVS